MQKTRIRTAMILSPSALSPEPVESGVPPSSAIPFIHNFGTAPAPSGWGAAAGGKAYGDPSEPVSPATDRSPAGGGALTERLEGRLSLDGL